MRQTLIGLTVSGTLTLISKLYRNYYDHRDHPIFSLSQDDPLICLFYLLDLLFNDSQSILDCSSRYLGNSVTIRGSSRYNMAKVSPTLLICIFRGPGLNLISVGVEARH